MPTVRQDVEMRARDGTTLVADVWSPRSGRTHPTLLIRTPYGKADRKHDRRPAEVDFFTDRGYTVVVQDTRGRGLSGGDYRPWFHEEHDGYDAVEWAASLPESDGRVGMTGQSYCASAQYLTAPSRPPHLRALCPVSGPTSLFHQRVYKRGVLELGWSLAYAVGMTRQTLVRNKRYGDERPVLDAWVGSGRAGTPALTDDAYREVPVGIWGDRLAALDAPYFAELLAHDTDGPYWQALEVSRRLPAINVPMFHVGSWYDAFQYDTLHLFTALTQHEDPHVRENQRLLMGPWGHLQPYTTPTSGGAGDIDFGPEARIELLEHQLHWFDVHLAGRAAPRRDEPPVRLFVMGTNRWRDEGEWPLSRAVEQRLHLHSGGRANTSHGDGSLSSAAPSEEPEDRYLYDPHDPAPTLGGPIPGEGLGVRDQRPAESRADVLVYTGSPLSRPLEVTGYLAVVLYAASSAPDTDFTAKLIDVWPDGFAQNLADGVVRARYRESLTDPSPIEPDTVYRYRIDLGATSHVVLPGHSLRLHISSSNFPRHDRNPNTGRSPLVETELRVAHQRVFHDGRYPSHVVLPIVGN